MNKLFAIAAFLVLAAATIIHAEPRWCSITGKGPNDKIYYPPIAKAARVQGVVLSHIIYEPSGKVVQVEAVSGPPMLSMSLAKQVSGWALTTDAKGDQLCETLVVADYRLNLPDGCKAAPEQEQRPIDLSAPSIFRMELSASAIPMCDWNAGIHWSPWQRFGHAMNWFSWKVFGTKRYFYAYL